MLSEESEDDIDMDGDDFKVSTKGKKKSYEVDYESLSQRSVEKLMQRDVDHICGIFGVEVCIASFLHFKWLSDLFHAKPDTAGLLLRYMKWNKEKLIEKYMDNAALVSVAAGVTVPEAPPPPLVRTQTISAPASTSRRPTTRGSKLLGLGSKSSKSSNAATSPRPPQRTSSKLADQAFVCQICFNDSPDMRTLALDCEHTYCTDCWWDYVVSKIRDESEHSIRCMAESCAMVAPDTFIRDLIIPEPGAPVGDKEKEELGPKMWSRLQELFVRHFVACNASLKFCPYPSCTNTVSCPTAASKASLTTIVPTVSCGARGIGNGVQDMSRSQQFTLGLQGKEHKFCFGCPIESDHRPVVCNVAKMWLKKCRDDSETANWIKSNTKECAQCQSTIEKNGGCK